VRDVIAASSALPGSSGANTAMAGGGAAMGAGTALAAVAGGGFRSFLDGCLDRGVDETPAPEQHPASSGKKQSSGMAVPTCLPVPAAATALRTPGFGLEPWGSPGETSAALALEVDAVSTQDVSGAGGSAPDPGPPPGWAGTAGRLARDLSWLQDDPAAKEDRDQGPGATPAATLELAFGARLLPPQPAPPSQQAAEGLPSPAAAAVSGEAATSPATDPQDRSIPAESVEAQLGHAGIPEPPHGPRTAPLDEGQAASPDTAIAGNARNAFPAAEGQTTADRRDAGPFAGAAPKSAPPSGDRPTGDHGESATAGQADTASVGNAASPLPASREMQGPVPEQPAGAARPAEAEPPEPAAQPVSRDVSLHLADGETSVDIRMAERAGEIRVTVHTPDRDLANSLRADLPDLVGKLRQSGFQAEAWRPASTASDAGRRGGSDGSPYQEHSPGARKDGRQPQPQQRKSKDASRWAGEWQSSLDPAQESHS